MRFSLLFLMAGLVAMMAARAGEEGRTFKETSGVALKMEAREILMDGVRRLLGTESGRRYFGDENPNMLIISDRVEAWPKVDVDGGWIVLWRYQKKDTKLFWNLGDGAQGANVPGFSDDAGIYCEIYIAYGRGRFNGNRLRLMTKDFGVSDAPMVQMAYYLIKKSDDATLTKDLVEVCEGMRVRFEAALAAGKEQTGEPDETMEVFIKKLREAVAKESPELMAGICEAKGGSDHLVGTLAGLGDGVSFEYATAEDAMASTVLVWRRSEGGRREWIYALPYTMKDGRPMLVGWIMPPARYGF